MKSQLDDEFEAMKLIFAALEPLSDDARSRIVNYIVARLDIELEPDADDDAIDMARDADPQLAREQGQAPKFNTFAELFDAAKPGSNSEKALVAGYWLQMCRGEEDFDGQSANRELKHLGEGIANITVAVNGLRSQKPAPVIQLKKSGKSQQARKTYKVTVAGIRVVEQMLGR